jgi:Type IV secretion-system coupling protein DNA-binding domain
MSRLEEQLTEQFRKWELRGRGWQVFSEPVSPEPPFVPFYGHYLPDTPVVDDGRKPTFLSSFVRKLSQSISTERPAPPAIAEPEEEPEPVLFTRGPLIELQTSLPAKLDIGAEAVAQFLRNLALCREPIAFELLGTAKRVKVQFATGEEDAPHVRRQLQAYFPEAVFRPCESTLEKVWNDCDGEDALVVEFGLAREFMFMLGSGKLDPFISIVGALSELQPSDLGLFQVLFQPVHERWAESILRSVTDGEGKPFFVNARELTGAAEKKVSHPLYAAVVRIAVKAETFERTLGIARDLASSLRMFAEPQGNELIPLLNDQYPFYEHVEDVLRRQSRRSGMLLNSDELIGFVHLPSSAVRSPALERETAKTKAAPAIARNATGLLLGNNLHVGESVPVRLSPDQRVRHTHIIGASGTGKSTLLFNLIRQDIEQGEGLAVLDPHGDLVDKVLGIIPQDRIGDVVLVDPSDTEHPIGFNILSAHSELEKNLLASDLVSVFRRLSTSWGDQMDIVFRNAILAFLESSAGGTLSDLRRFLIEPNFRNQFLATVRDPEVVYYWQKVFPHLTGSKSIGPVLTRLQTLLSQKSIRLMVSQPENRLDFAEIMDSGKIFLAKLPQGLMGTEDSYLFGTLLVSKFQQLAMSRQAQQMSLRRDFWLYIDEFDNFITPSMAEILKGARKYRLGLTLAHHELHQLQRNADVASAVMSHPATRIVFRVGDEDAKKLAEGFSFFAAQDLKNLEVGQAIARVERSDFDFNLSVPLPEKIDEGEAAQRRQEVITVSREKYGTPRAQVEAALLRAWEAEMPSSKPTKTETPREPSPTPKPPPMTAAVPVSLPVPIAEPKATEVPKETDSEKDIVGSTGFSPPVVAQVDQPSVARESKPPRDLGKGGAQHQAIQRRIKEAAEGFGFRSVIEKQLSESQESMDLLLERGDQKIACEISVTTTIDHEVGNVTKCLKAGMPTIAIICLDEGRLRKIAAAVSGSLGAAASTQVSYYLPDQFLAYLETLPLPVPKDSVTTRQGYKVKRSAPKLTLLEQQQREHIANRVMAEALRPRR